jgi:CheY-like chemotaxis protein
MEPTILVVDDHPGTCGLIQRVLTRQGYGVVTVGDGEAALAAVVTERPSLVIVDVLLPGLDGVTVLTRLRQHNPRLPLIAMSADYIVPDLEGIPVPGQTVRPEYPPPAGRRHRGGIARGSWTWDSAVIVVTDRLVSLHSPNEQDFSGKTLEEGVAWGRDS